MKTNIHPQWYPDATITCACGHVLTIGSTKQTVRVEICSQCHPFFTGQMKYIDTQGRVEKFQKKQAYAQTKVSDMAKKKLKKKGQITEDKSPKTLREMLMGA